MSRKKGYRSGQIVWAVVADRNGVRKPDPRPLLVIAPDPASPSSPLCCLCISTAPGNDPSDPAIEMLWDKATGDTTGLFEWCRVVLLWHVLVSPKDIKQGSGGFVTKQFLKRVMEERERAMSFGSSATGGEA